MNSFDDELKRRLATLREQRLYRELRRVDSPQSPHIRVDTRSLRNFSSNDYLGLANEPVLKEAAIRAIERYGAGAGAARLVSGSLAPHHELESALAGFKGTEAALTFSTGYATALGTINALLGKDDVIVVDKLVHASIVDAARLCGAKLRVFDHNDLNDLEKILRWSDSRRSPDTSLPRRSAAKAGPSIPDTSHLTPDTPRRTLVVTESVFSMDGDRAPLREIVALKEKHGAWLMVDEAHATGLFGVNRRGVAEELGVSDRIEIQMGTLGKAIGAAGGYICGSRTLIEFLVNRARSFIFSTAPVPAAAAAATAGIQLVQTTEGETRRSRAWELAKQLARAIHASRDSAPASLILPLVIGEENEALQIAARLLERGIYVPAIRYPTVARGSARLRFTITAAHDEEDVRELSATLGELAATPREIANSQ